MKQADVAWAAGLFEGEGSFISTSVVQRGRRYLRVQASLHMTDKDVMDRFAAIVGAGTVTGPYTYSTKTTKRKPSYYWSVQSVSRVKALIVLFRPWLGKRRREKARQVLAYSRSIGKKGKRDKRTGRFYAS